MTLVDAAEFATLKGIAARRGPAVPADANEVALAEQTFRLSDKVGLTYVPNPDDVREVLDAVRAGKGLSDLNVFTIHAHETASGGQEHEMPSDTLAPANFLQPLCQQAIDAGADVVINHGPHVLRGIEIYKGKPIFYGLGSLFFEVDLFKWPADWYDSAVAVTKYRNGSAAEVRLYPVLLRAPGGVEPRSNVGRRAWRRARMLSAS
jgi:poly-gamma-glutamate synthesis protein (capsule biosynthesis protein)